jgi:hypothetical protein
MVQLKEKDKQLEENKKQVNLVGGYWRFSANIILLRSIQLEKAPAVLATPGMGELKTGLAIANQTIGALQKAFW